MTKQTTKQPAPQPQQDETEAAAPNVTPIRTGGARKSLLSAVASERATSVEAKMQHVGEARQRFAEAKDLFAQGNEYEAEARDTAAKGALILYQARVTGEVSADEVSAILIDQFGAKPKSDGSPGKTPAGEGEALRKRIVRFVDAETFASGGDTSRFFEGMKKEDVAKVMNNVRSGKLPFWQAYEKLAEMKREGSAGREPAAYDPKAIAKIVNTLAEAGAAQRLADDVMLQKAYASLRTMIDVIDEQAAEIVEKAKAA